MGRPGAQRGRGARELVHLRGHSLLDLLYLYCEGIDPSRAGILFKVMIRY